MTPENRAPVLKPILRLRNARSSCLPTHGSSAGTSDGRASMMVTSAPSEAQMDANSTPITPPPSTSRLLRDPLQAEGLLAGDHPAGDLQPGQRAGVRAGGQHDVGADVAVVADHHGGRRLEPALALDHGDAVRLDDALQTLPVPADDAVLVLVQALDVDAVELGVQADRGGFLDLVGHLGGVQQRLGRDAAAVQTGAAELALLDQHHLGARVRPRGSRRRSRRSRRRVRPGRRWCRSSVRAPRIASARGPSGCTDVACGIW